jgi:DNA-binding NarL/FixJ family response regulator
MTRAINNHTLLTLDTNMPNTTTIQIEVLKKHGFTERELDVLTLFCRGQSDKQIAKSLLISNRTVQTHINHIYRELGITHAATNKRLTAFINLAANEMIRITRAKAAL